MKIARDAAWLLNQRGLLPGLKSFWNRCLCLLADCGLATYSGRVDATELLKAFKNYYSPNLLLALMCEVDAQSQHNWLLVLTEIVETREEFAVRRVRWAAECFRQENVCPQQWHLVRRSGLRPEMAAVPQVKEAIASAMIALDPLYRADSAPDSTEELSKEAGQWKDYLPQSWKY